MSSEDRFSTARRRFRPPVAFVATTLILLLAAASFAAEDAPKARKQA